MEVRDGVNYWAGDRDGFVGCVQNWKLKLLHRALHMVYMSRVVKAPMVARMIEAGMDGAWTSNCKDGSFKSDPSD